MFNMNNLSKYLLVKITVISAVLFTAAGAWSADSDQEERIKKMGFVSISETTDDESEPVKRVPQPKVINIPEKAPNPYIKETAKSSPPKKASFKSDEPQIPSSFVELDNPIIVYADGQTAVKTPKSDVFEVALSDDVVKESAASIFGDKPSSPRKGNDFQAEPKEHVKDAHNYYNYDNVDRNFKRFADNSTNIKTVSLEDLERTEMAKETNSQYNENTPPSINLNYKSEDQKMGIPGVETNTQVTIGYRVDDLDWNIAGSLAGTGPNILSELTWDDLQMVELKGKANVVLANYLVFDGKAGYGKIIDGKNQDSDYDSDNRTGEFSRSNNATDDGHVWDYSFGGGVRFPVKELGDLFMEEDMWISFLGGYSRHKQHLIITDLNQTVPFVGSFPGLESRYSAQWEGPWVGVEVSGTLKRWKGWGRFEYHFPEYQGDATWNLREEFVQPGSFIHWADDGRGIVVEGGGTYQLSDIWSFALVFTIQDWEMDPGIDRVYFTDGDIIDTRLNEVNWDSLSLSFGLTARF